MLSDKNIKSLTPYRQTDWTDHDMCFWMAKAVEREITSRVKVIIASDAWAISHQSLKQYREGLLAHLNLITSETLHEEIERVLKGAEIYRENNGRAFGYVVIFEGEVCSWLRDMPEAKNWRPGCFAVGPCNEVYLSEGGNDKDGAERLIKLREGLE